MNETFDLSSDSDNLDNISKTIDTPWALNFVSYIKNYTKKATLQWLELALEIDPNENSHKENITAFLEKIDCTFCYLISNMHKMHQMYVERNENLVRKICVLEKNIEVEKSFTNLLDENLSLKEMELKLQSQVDKYENVLRENQKEIEKLNDKYIFVSQRLCISPKLLLTDCSIKAKKQFIQELDDLELEVNKRERKVLAIKEDIEKVCQRNGFKLEEKCLDIINSIPLKITDKDIGNLKDFYLEIINLENNLNDKVEKLKCELANLWNFLNISNEEKRLFLSSIENKNLEDYCHLLKGEIEKFKTIKIEKLRQDLDNLYTEINKLWDVCCCGSAVKNTIPNFDSKENNEEKLLEIFTGLNKELEKWKIYYNENKDILQTVKSYITLKTSLQELNQTGNSKTVYQNRGGSLLTELKKRKVLNLKAQALENKLMEFSKNYLKSKGQLFLIFDTTIEDYIKRKTEPVVGQQNKNGSTKNFQVKSTSGILNSQVKVKVGISRTLQKDKKINKVENKQVKTNFNSRYGRESLISPLLVKRVVNVDYKNSSILKDYEEFERSVKRHKRSSSVGSGRKKN